MPASDLGFGGEETFTARPEQLFALLTDLESLSRTIPDLVFSRRVDERTLECVVRPGVSFLRGMLRLTISVEALKPTESAALRLVARGIGAELAVESRMQLAAVQADPASTRLTWSANVVDLKGLVATLSRSLIAAAAEKQIQATWLRVREQLEA
jgi:carbon monoxide dehydrogenase subunit G